MLHVKGFLSDRAENCCENSMLERECEAHPESAHNQGA